LASQIEKIVDEMDWALVKVKGDVTSSVTGVAGERATCIVIHPLDSKIDPLINKACY